MIQLDFFQVDETVILRNEIKRMDESLNKTRRALFARHGELGKLYVELHARLEVIERNICKE